VDSGELNFAFQRDENVFTLSKNISQNTDYQIVTSNNRVEDYEKLNYQLSGKDSISIPFIQVTHPDSLKLAKNFVLEGGVDDYAVLFKREQGYGSIAGSLLRRRVLSYSGFVDAFIT
jgi:hypothetical protein